MNQPGIRFALIVAILVSGISSGICQTTMPEVLDKGTLTEQMKFVEEKTRIYEQYRAIREDMFQKIKINSVDSLTKAKARISGFVTLTGNLNSRIDSLNNNLNSTREELKEMTRTKNSISILGIKLDKIAYNAIMWTIMAGLVLLLIMGYLTFRRNHMVTVDTKKELKELRDEFEEYRKKTRLDREKMSMDHFKEIQKLKGG
jgi:hypothetical protein